MFYFKKRFKKVVGYLLVYLDCRGDICFELQFSFSITNIQHKLVYVLKNIILHFIQ